MELIVTTAEQLNSIIFNAVSRALNKKPEPQQLPDRCGFGDALEITGLSKSKLYKLTASNEIPHKRFGSRLIFSRKELLTWLESQTVDKHDSSEVHLALARSARRKKKGGIHA